MIPLGDFLEERDARRAANAERGALAPDWRPATTKAPETMISALMATIGREFYREADARTWLRDERDLKLVLTWPATWLTQRGVGLPVERYEGIVREIVAGIVQHGDRAAIRHFPTYFGHVVRQWFVHNGEALYEERKRARNLVDLRTLMGRSGVASTPDPTAALAAAHAVLATRKRATKASRPDGSDQPTFGF